MCLFSKAPAIYFKLLPRDLLVAMRTEINKKFCLKEKRKGGKTYKLDLLRMGWGVCETEEPSETRGKIYRCKVQDMFGKGN